MVWGASLGWPSNGHPPMRVHSEKTSGEKRAEARWYGLDRHLSEIGQA